MDDQKNPQQPTQSPVQGTINLNQQPPIQSPPPQSNDPLPPSTTDTPPPTDGRKIVRIALIIFSILFFITIIVLGVVAYQRNQTFIQNEPTPTPQEEVIVTPTLIPTNTPVASPSGYINNTAAGEGKVYISDTLGIQFRYLPTIANEVISTFETERKVYVYPKSIEPQDGQWVEVFEKQADDSIEDAITKQFLAGKDSSRCFVTQLEKPDSNNSSGLWYEIRYPFNESEGYEGSWEKTEYCAPDYAMTNGIRYFWYDPTYPTKYAFFSIGQYAITAGDEVTWQDTFQFNK